MLELLKLPSLRLGAAACALLAAAGGGIWLGSTLKQADWDAAELERTRETARRAAIHADRAWEASAAHERARAAQSAALRKARDELQAALNRPLDCPESGRLGDVLLPADALGRVRDAAGQPADTAPADEPGAAL